jgi:hypothetical protein
LDEYFNVRYVKLIVKFTSENVLLQIRQSL